MADRGTQAAILDATQEIVEDFEHLPESEEGAFPEVFAPEVTDPAFLTDGTFTHSPEAEVDWDDQFTKHAGDGWYMTEPVTGLAALQGQARGDANVAGALQMDMLLAPEPVAGVATVAAPLRRDFDFAGISDGRTTLSAANLRRAFAFEGQSDGRSILGTEIRLAPLGAYRAAVLASAPAAYLHFNEDDATYLEDFLNDDTLGGGEIGHADPKGGGTPGTTYTRAPGASLVQTESGGTVALGSADGWQGAIRLDPDVIVPTLSWTQEFWYKTTEAGGGSHYMITCWAEYEEAPDDTYGFNQLQLAARHNSAGKITIQHSENYFFNSPGYVDITGTKTINDGLPHHIVITYDPFDSDNKGRLSLYVDGVLDVSGVGASTRRGVLSSLWAGQEPGAPYEMINSPLIMGSVSLTSTPRPVFDEWAYYYTALTATDVAVHYDAAFTILRLRGSSAGVATTDAALAPFGGELELAGEVHGVAAVAATLIEASSLLDLAGASAGLANVWGDLTVRTPVPLTSDGYVRVMRRAFS